MVDIEPLCSQRAIRHSTTRVIVMTRDPHDQSSLATNVAHVLGWSFLAVVLVVLLALAIAWLSPTRESVLRFWWRCASHEQPWMSAAAP